MTDAVAAEQEPLDKFLANVLEAHKDGMIRKADAIAAISHVVGAIGDGKLDAAKSYMQNYPSFGGKRS